MKHKDDRTMIVLGAGASMGARRRPIDHPVSELMIPCSRHFFYDLFKHRGLWDKEMFLNELGLTDEGTNQLLVRAWGLKKNLRRFDPSEWRDVDVEEVFTFLDVGERTYSRGSNYQLTFAAARSMLENFIFANLAVRCQGQHCGYHRVVFAKLQPQDSIISFNWDTIADHSLEGWSREIYRNYVQLMTEEKVQVRKYVHRGLLLKLHGSLNWVVCRNRGCVRFGLATLPTTTESRLFPKLLQSESRKCPACGATDTERFIVPPVSNKLIHRDAFLRKLWLIARWKLAFTRKIVFIGYSFPPADSYSEWLFRQVNFLEGGRPEIVVVNPEYSRRGSAVRKRYNAIFRGCRITSFKTLADYAGGASA
jgi:hypothetical protein